MVADHRSPDVEEAYLSDTVHVYDKIAPAYSQLWCVEGQRLRRRIDQFLSLLEFPPDVLDAGCGPGRDVEYMLERTAHVVGVDLSVSMLEECTRRIQGGVFRRMDVRRLAYPPSTFSGIWSCAVLQHLSLSQKRTALAEFSRVLRPGGVLAIAVEEGEGRSIDHLARHLDLVSQETLVKMVAEAGFDIRLAEIEESQKVTLAPDRLRRWIHILAQSTASATPTPSIDGCPFCTETRFVSVRGPEGAGAESILVGDEDLWLVPDIAPLVEGHLLLISTKHHLCFGDWPTSLDEKLRNVRARIVEMLMQTYRQKVVIVEHGGTHCGAAGSCINHAHWHFLPTGLPIRSAFEARLGAAQPASLETLRQLYQRGQSYLYIDEPGSEAGAFPVQDLPSQFLRQTLVALRTGGPWRWQTSYRTPESAMARRNAISKLTPFIDDAPCSPDQVELDEEVLND